jgi:hypothetical protein
MEKYMIFTAILAIWNLIIAYSTKNKIIGWITGILAIVFLGALTVFTIIHT